MSDSHDNFSQTFYPFLHDIQKQPQELMAELRFSLLEKARESVTVKQRFFEEQKDAILQASLALARAYHAGRKMLVCGNGGGD